jgi:hypothetical protein
MLMKMLKIKDHSKHFLMLVSQELQLVTEYSVPLKEPLMEVSMFHIKLKSSQVILEQRLRILLTKKVKPLILKELKLSMMLKSTEQEFMDNMLQIT